MDLENILKSQDPDLFSCLQDIKKFCSETWSDKLLPWFTNHDCDHSREIVHLLAQILKPLEEHPQFLDKHELFALLSSAYLHDIGMQYLKVDNISIDKLTEEEYGLIRKRHAQASYDIILKRVSNFLLRDDFHLPTTIDEEYLPVIARISKGHSTDYFDEVIGEFKDDPLTPKGRKVRGELLTALLMIADELDLQCKRVDFSDTPKFNLSDYSNVHWFKHHYVDFIEVANANVNITLRFPQKSDAYSGLIQELIETKLKEQIEKINHIMSDSTGGILHLNPAINIVKKEDKTGVKRPLPENVLIELKKIFKQPPCEASPAISSGASFHTSTPPKPSIIFTGRKVELEKFRKAFNSANFISIEGWGGIGKTEFAAKCIEEYISKDKVVWFDCLPDSKLDSLINNSGYPDVLKGENKTELAKYSGFTDLIDRDEKVIFLDNFQNILDISFQSFFKFTERRLQKAKVILIDRGSPDAGVRFASVPLIGLANDSFEYAKKLIDTYYSDVTIGDIALNNICDKLGGHPLAIDLAVQLLRYGESPDDIIQKIVQAKDKSKELSDKLLDEIFNHPKSSEKEKRFMLHFSVFRGDVDRGAFPCILDDQDISETLRRVQDKKMIMRSTDSGLYSTHPLIREFCYQRLENKDEVHLKAVDYFTTIRKEKFDPLLEEEISYHLSTGNHFKKAANFISEKGDEFIRSGHTNSLKEMIDKVRAKGIERPEFYVFYGDIANIRGVWSDASSYFEKVFTFSNVNEKTLAESYIKFGEMLYRKGDVKESLKYFEDAHDTCKNNVLKKEEARSINDIGLVHNFFGNLTVAECKLNEALKIRYAIQDKDGIATSLGNVGNVLDTKGDLDGALNNYKMSLRIREEIGDKGGIALSLSNIGNVLDTKGDIDGALNNYKMSLRIREEVGDKGGIALSLSNIGNVMRTKGDIDGALNNYNMSLRIYEEIGGKRGIATSLNNIGCVLDTKGDIDGALNNYKMSLRIYEEIGDKAGIATSRGNIGDVMATKGDIDGALNNYKMSLSIYEEIGDKKCSATCYHNLGTYFHKIGDYKISLKNLFLSLALQNQIGIKRPGTKEYILGIRKSIGLKNFKEVAITAFNELSEKLKQYINVDDFIKEDTVHYKTKQPGRNDPCICGSGKKYKKCCGK